MNRDQEVRRDVALALQCWLADDQQGVIDILKTTDDVMAFALNALGAAGHLLSYQTRPQTFIDALASDELTAQVEKDLSATARARRFVTHMLADGPQWMVAVKAKALAEGHDWKAVRNAAQQLGVISEMTQGVRTWRLPGSEGTPVTPGFRGRVKATSGDVIKKRPKKEQEDN